MKLPENIAGKVKRLNPGCFAMVMATGIVSIDLAQHDMPGLARMLLALNAAIYLWLLGISAWRVLVWPQAVRQDFADPSRGAAFLTLAAGTLVLASQCLIVVHWPRLALLLAAFGALCWLALMYAFLAGTITAHAKPRFTRSINGSWLVAVVATQALSATLSQFGSDSRGLQFTALCLYMLGAALYLMIITLVVYRMVFLRLSARDFTPPYWINMGALAITTLAGSELIMHAVPQDPMIGLMPFVKGFTVFFWATATWWIPLLLILEAWRHILRHVPLRYETDDWDIVFPVGMYTVGTFALARAIDADFLLPIPAVGVYVSLAVWLLVALSGVAHGLRRA